MQGRLEVLKYFDFPKFFKGLWISWRD